MEWESYELGELLLYEQPTPYIVESTNYDDSFKTPVLTAGKSFILGYTNEKDGIFDRLPVIIFDDFTTASQYVNFRFKVKSSAMKLLTPVKELVLPKFIYYRMQIVNFDHSTHKRYWIQQYSKIRVSIPPLSEQKCIVARIEELFSELDKVVETLKTVKEQLAVYRQAVLKEAFLPYTSHEMLDKLSERIFDGPFGTNLKTEDYVNSGVRVVRLENIKNMWFDDSKKSYVTKDKYETIKKHTIRPTDLIMSTFISDSIKVCQMPNYIEFAVNKADCVGIRLKQEYLPKFYMYYLSQNDTYRTLENLVHGATRPRVNTKQIKSIMVPLCSFDEQVKTVERIEKRLSYCDAIEQSVDHILQRSETLRQSILEKALNGSI